jgi:hypothetical protein
MSHPVMGHDLAHLQPVPVPLFHHFEWSSENSPQEGASDVLSSQLGVRVLGEPLKKTTAQTEAFAPSADQMRAHFESLLLATMTHPPKSPATHSDGITPTPLAESPSEKSAPTARDRYASVSANAIGAYLTVARFWIPPGPDRTSGSWSNPVLTVIGAPTPTVDAVPVDRLKAFPGARFLAPSSFPLPASHDLTILAGTVASGM